jgi:hypothetical protein
LIGLCELYAALHEARCIFENSRNVTVSGTVATPCRPGESDPWKREQVWQPD